MHDFRKLRAWEQAHHLTLDIYRLTSRFPPDERYGLTSQMRRSAASVPTNLAEGSGRPSNKDFARFASIALGSASELLYQLRLATDLGLIDVESARELTERTLEVRRLTNRLRQALDRGEVGTY